MMAAAVILLLVFLLAVETPIAFAVGIAAFGGLLLTGLGNAPIAAQRMFSGMNSYGLLALPLFILAGNLLVAGGIIQRLVAFADLVVGRIRGGLAHANIVANLMMAGVSGSATADTAALGSVMVPMMQARGYAKDFAAALTISGAIMAPIIPPSLIMVIYAIPTKLSIGAMFFAGILPGIAIALLLMAYVAFACRRHPVMPRAGADDRGLARSLADAIPVLIAPVIIVGGVRGGVFTATEAAAVLVAYSLFLTQVLYRSIDRKALFAVFRDSALTTATVMIVVATSSLFAWFLALENVPNAARDLFTSMTDNPYVFLLIVNVFLLIVGCLVDTVPAILIFVPILQPTAVQFGIDPIHFAIVVIVNLMIGLNTPPIGTNLFVISSVAGRPVGAVTRALLPFYAIKLVALALITYVPTLSLWLPKAAGLIR
jgi:C4-dicarboxylate transporter DctM subunit